MVSLGSTIISFLADHGNAVAYEHLKR